jgi:hypothetical protein
MGSQLCSPTAPAAACCGRCRSTLRVHTGVQLALTLQVDAIDLITCQHNGLGVSRQEAAHAVAVQGRQHPHTPASGGSAVQSGAAGSARSMLQHLQLLTHTQPVTLTGCP